MKWKGEGEGFLVGLFEKEGSTGIRMEGFWTGPMGKECISVAQRCETVLDPMLSKLFLRR